MRKTRVVASIVLAATAIASSASAAPPEGERGTFFSSLLERLEPFLSIVLPESVGPDADPNGLLSPPPGSEQHVGPGADPDG